MKRNNLLAGTGLATLLLFSASAAFAQISLGTAQNFGVLAGSAVTNTGATTVNGNVGVSPGSSVTGFPPGVVVGGAIHSNDAVAMQAQNDLTTAYNNIASTPCTVDLTGQDLGGLTLTPGVYCYASTAQLTGTLTLNALGNANALFLFKIGSALTTASGSSVTVINNGGSSCNKAYWQVGSSATIGTGSSFAGDILALEHHIHDRLEQLGTRAGAQRCGDARCQQHEHLRRAGLPDHHGESGNAAEWHDRHSLQSERICVGRYGTLRVFGVKRRAAYESDSEQRHRRDHRDPNRVRHVHVYNHSDRRKRLLG